jgi:hypothetical protein
MTWSNAQQYCINDSSSTGINRTGSITHLVALESAFETTSLLFWMKGYFSRFVFFLFYRIFSLC